MWKFAGLWKTACKKHSCPAQNYDTHSLINFVTAHFSPYTLRSFCYLVFSLSVPRQLCRQSTRCMEVGWEAWPFLQMQVAWEEPQPKALYSESLWKISSTLSPWMYYTRYRHLFFVFLSKSYPVVSTTYIMFASTFKSLNRPPLYLFPLSVLSWCQT